MSSEVPNTPSIGCTTSVCTWALLGSHLLTLTPALQRVGNCSITGSSLTQGIDGTAGIREETEARF